MANRLTQIATRTGDDGSTGLGDGTRVSKDSARVAAYGTVDEANSAIGLLLASAPLPGPQGEAIATLLTTIQHQLFDLGGELCIPGYQMIKEAHVERLPVRVSDLVTGDPQPPYADIPVLLAHSGPHRRDLLARPRLGTHRRR